MIRVHIRTDSTISRAGLQTVLAEYADIEVVSSEADADVIVAEEEERSDVPTVLLTDEAIGAEAFHSGIRAVLPRDAAPTQIAAAIYAAAAGLVAMPAGESTPLSSLAHPDGTVERLTPREMDVLEMLAEGLSNKLIAYRLDMSEHTAKFHVNSILAKLNAATRTEAVMRGVRLGLIKI